MEGLAVAAGGERRGEPSLRHSRMPRGPPVRRRRGEKQPRGTMAEVGLPGRPRTSLPPARPSQTGLPGFIATFEK